MVILGSIGVMMPAGVKIIQHASLAGRPLNFRIKKSKPLLFFVENAGKFWKVEILAKIHTKFTLNLVFVWVLEHLI